MNKKQRDFINIYFDILPRTLPMELKSELYSVNDFTFAVAVILSAQATDKKVNEVTPELFKIVDSPEKMLKLGEEGLKKYIRVISFFNNKAKNIIALSRRLVDEYDGTLPGTKSELVALPGIGNKTANVIMNVLHGAPTVGVDTHVFRNAHRYGWVSDAANTPDKVEAELMQIIPKKYHGIVNHVMVLHGRYTCSALRPKCDICPLIEYCPAVSDIQNKKKK